ncbi:MAG TPA: DUF1353 domain-containing protein [Gammaproteobacteria bacterium]|nr:DUF1353 domain-containing protein [Gammaproteobacteria bacterium]
MALPYPCFEYDPATSTGILTDDIVFMTPIKTHVAVTVHIVLAFTGRLVLRKGYIWDFATGAVDTPDMVVPSLVHDAFCDLINAGEIPKSCQSKADRHFMALMKQYNVAFARRWWVYLAVRAYSLIKSMR